MIGKLLGALILGITGLLVYLYVYLGISKPVTIAVGARGPFAMVYKNHIGAYHEIGASISAVEKWAADHKLSCEPSFGEYLDDPAAIDQDRLRSRGGCVLAAKPSVPLPPDFTFEERPRRDYVIGTFTGAPSAGPFKVYPKIQEYIQTQRLKSSGAVMESYFIRGEKVTTEFLFPLESPAAR